MLIMHLKAETNMCKLKYQNRSNVDGMILEILKNRKNFHTFDCQNFVIFGILEKRP